MKVLFTLAVCLVTILATYSVSACTGEPRVLSIDELLTEFEKAIRTADVDSMERLFLPPDDSIEGQNRSSNLTELRKDWKGRRDGPPLRFESRQAVIKIEMTDLDPDGPPSPHVSEIELKIVRTDGKWRILSMQWDTTSG